MYTHTQLLYCTIRRTVYALVRRIIIIKKKIIIICFRSLCNQIIVITIINSTQSLPPTDTCVTCIIYYGLSRGNSLSVSAFFWSHCLWIVICLPYDYCYCSLCVPCVTTELCEKRYYGLHMHIYRGNLCDMHYAYVQCIHIVFIMCILDLPIYLLPTESCDTPTPTCVRSTYNGKSGY